MSTYAQIPFPLSRDVRSLGERAWWNGLVWVAAAAIVGYLVPAIFVGLLRLPRDVYLVPYLAAVAAIVYGYVRWSGLDVGESLRRHWIAGVVVGGLASVFTVRTVLMQPGSPAPTGAYLVFSLLWLGLAYGVADALFLIVLPLTATWRAFSELGWTERWPGRIGVGALALVASLAVIGVYHLGYPELSGAEVLVIMAGVGITSLLTLLAGSPLVALIAHVAMHVSAVLYGFSSVSQLPPHY